MATTPAIERLAALVQQAEAKASAKRLGSEIQAAAARLHASEERLRVADRRVREVRPTLTRELERIEGEEQTLTELIQKTAKFKSYLDPNRDRDAEALIDEARAELSSRRQVVQAELSEINREGTESRKEFQAAVEQYQHLRKELDRLQPQLAADYASEDRLVLESSVYLPVGQLQSLAREIADSAAYFGMIDSRQQLAQLKIWIGRYRLLQESDLADFTEEQQARLRQIFPELVGISKRYKPGYIEAFQQNFTADWVTYIAEAKAELALAVEDSTRSKAYETQQREQQTRDEESRRLVRESARSSLEQLGRLVAMGHLIDDPTEEQVDEFRTVLRAVIGGFGASDPEVLDLILPLRDLVQGNDLRVVRRNLDRVVEEETRGEQGLAATYFDVFQATKGLRALMIGGSVREENRRKLEKLFGFAELEWAAYESGRPAALDSIERRVRNRGMDLVLILKYVGHHVTERLRPVCEQGNVPCFMTHSYGATQIAETIRKGLYRLGQTPPPRADDTPSGSSNGVAAGSRSGASGSA